ncbi:MAG TPA: hypothetical protein VHM31_12970 [Polyangia bacterium]|nr:hypothetical protein [Polyangia bacterium]
MTSNFKRTLQAALAVVAVVGSAAAARAETTEPAAPPPAASGPPTTTPGEFIDAGQWLLSVEHLFGYTYAHQSNNLHVNSFTLLGDSDGSFKSFYNWPRLALDTMVTRSISVGLAATFVRTSITQGISPNTSTSSNTGYEGAFRVGYAMMLGPWLGIWPRAGVTYAHQTAGSAFAVTVEGLIVAAVLPHLLVTVGPVADIGLSGKRGNQNVTYLNIGAYVGLAVPF